MTRSFRTQSICRSTNTETEGRCGRATCIGGPTSACCGQLLLPLWALFLSPEYGGLYHGSFRRSRADSGFDYYFESVRLRRLYSLSSDRFLQFSYRTIPILFVHKELAFDSLGATRAFLEDHSCAFYVDKNQENLDCKRANAVLNEVYESKYRKVGIKGAIWSISIAPSWCHLYPPLYQLQNWLLYRSRLVKPTGRGDAVVSGERDMCRSSGLLFGYLRLSIFFILTYSHSDLIKLRLSKV